VSEVDLTKIILGSASWGSRYGEFNEASMALDEIPKLISYARKFGINEIDTAPSYGDAEEGIGAIPTRGTLLYTKVSRRDWDAGAESVQANLENSMASLRVSRLRGLIFHSAESLLREPRRAEAFMRRTVEDGIADQWGVSVYTPKEAAEIIRVCRPDFIQLPASVADRRFEAAGLLDEMKLREIRVHARSIFLQGVLLQPPMSLPSFLAPLRTWMSQFQKFADELGLTRLQICLLYVLMDVRYDKVLIGVNSENQLRQILTASLRAEPSANIADLLPVNQESLLDPRMWKS
jgi:hypothetical protein